MGLSIRLHVEFEYSSLFNIGAVPERGKGGRAHLAVWENEMPGNQYNVCRLVSAYNPLGLSK